MIGIDTKLTGDVTMTYSEMINIGPHPDESHTWKEGDILEFGGGGVNPDYSCVVRFVRLDPHDTIGFYAAEIIDGKECGISGAWTRGRFRKVSRDEDTHV